MGAFVVGALLTGALSAWPAQAADSEIIRLTCPGLGSLEVVPRPDAPPSPAQPLPRGARLLIGYTATDLRTHAHLTRAPTDGSATDGAATDGAPGALVCGQVRAAGVSASALPGGPRGAGAPQGAGVRPGDRFDVTYTIAIATTDVTPPPPGLSAAAVPGAGSPFPFEAALRSYLDGRSGRVSVAVYDATSGATYSYGAGTQFVTASIVKVAILGTLLRQAQDARRSLTATERSLATRMIERSDNDAATALWNEVGKGPAVGRFTALAGMASTTPGPGGYWGLTSTNTPDQVKLLRAVAYSNTVLTAASRGYLESLMRSVTPSQRWGVSAGPPSGTAVALKNGWLPREGGWVINSIGHVSGAGRDYVIAVLSSGGPSMNYGIDTVRHVATRVWNDLPRRRPADLYGVLTGGTGSGQLELHTLSASTRYAAWAGHRVTAFAPVVSADWAFAVAPTAGDRAPDLIGAHLRNTASGHVEVHVASAASGYTRFTRHTATALAALDPAHWQVAVGSLGGSPGDGSADLVAVGTDATGSGNVEVHALSESSNYQRFTVHAATPLAAGPTVATAWRFLLGAGGDLVAVRHQGAPSGASAVSEVHVLTRASGYTRWGMQVTTPLGPADGAQWHFSLGDADADGTADLFAVRTAGGGSGHVEVHILSGAAHYGSWLLHATTPLAAPTTAWQWSAF